MSKQQADCENGYLSITGWDDQGRCPYCHPIRGNKEFKGRVSNHKTKPPKEVK